MSQDNPTPPAADDKAAEPGEPMTAEQGLAEIIRMYDAGELPGTSEDVIERARAALSASPTPAPAESK